MKNLKLICLGKLKEKYWQEAEKEYLKRLSPYFKIQILELREESFSEKDSPATFACGGYGGPREKIKNKEAEKILSALSSIKNPHIIILDETGNQFSSIKFAEQVGNLASNNLVFIIGGPLGLAETIFKKASLKLSLSKMTFTHQMARVFLWEQIYRATMIGAGRKYHY